MARSRLLAETLLAGSPVKSRSGLAEQIQELGAPLTAAADSDQLLISGVVLTPYLVSFLELIAHVLASAVYFDGKVDAERGRLAQRLRIARSRAGVRAMETLHQHLYGHHPYANDLPTAEDVAAVTAHDLRRLYAERVTPMDSVLVLVW